MESVRERSDDIQGWGIDLDPKDRPAVPKERTPPRLDNVPWDTPEQQPVRVEVLYSPERPGITPVFGTACPPAGLSGAIRRYAFRHSENDVRHWMLLLAADRVNAVEGIVSDVRTRPQTRRIAAGLLVGGVLAYVMLRRHSHRRGHGAKARARR